MAELTFVAVNCVAVVLLTKGFANLTTFKNTAEAESQRDAGRSQVFAACWLLVGCTGVAAYVGSPIGAVLTVVVVLSAFYVGRTTTAPTWLPLFTLPLVVPALVGSTASVLLS